MVAKDKDGNNTPVPGLILDSEESIRRFARSLKRQKDGRLRDSTFSSEEFKVEDYLAELEGKNAQITFQPNK
ncbi:MAG: hypothetical protein F6K19_21370 [Cyanothece sp. SIO1E1]|nr:hypothetical protein [Cyanothece sp. SIO1E1]